MKILILGIVCAIYIAMEPCSSIRYVDLPQDKKSSEKADDGRKYWIKNFGELQRKSLRQKPAFDDEKDENLKAKIATLMEQTLYDTDRKIKSVKAIKDSYRDKLPYKVGFILKMVKKSRDVLNELFNVAVKHREEWKALEQLKIYELIVHTNVDTTNLVRQLVEIHIQNLNTTNGPGRRVVLLK